MTPDTTPALDERQCLRLLATASVGRVVYTVGALPAVLPTRYLLDGDAGVLLSAAADSELIRAVSGALVAFEVGEVDEADGSGWTVTVLGRADVSAEPPPAEAAPMVRPTGRVTVRIRPELLKGRVLPASSPCRPGPAGGHRPAT
ncbi:pyridoxamine 5'-phosphate oxidase family protein [Streptomyces sp. NRRL S-350]|uniref:pyridoxamine 5'-phosphate oxidase family protein n=1 Tax=Streptomyces sp. NRRL S-350 TaxID=1463902 RepID=UPI000689D34D|nr:pyridoxamine 5'-phosphate oxidase family protein [Streptomyces sp. NRRL S-350]